jgi:hypothetical protein
MQVCGAGVWESERVLRCVAMRREGLEGGGNGGEMASVLQWTGLAKWMGWTD